MTARPVPPPALIGLLDTFALSSEAEVRQRVVDTVAIHHGAELVAIVAEGVVLHASGVGMDDALRARLASAAGAGDGPPTVERRDLPPLGPVHLATLPVTDGGVGRLVLARSQAPFDQGELQTCQAMIRIMRLATRTVEAFDRQVRITERLATQIEANLRMTRQLQQRHTDVLGRLLAIQELLNGSSGSAVEAIVEQAGMLLGGAIVGLQVQRPDGSLELHHITPNAPPQLVEALSRVPAGEGIGNLAIERGELVRFDGFTEGPRTLRGLGPLGTSSVVSAPVRRRNEVVGALTANWPGAGRPITREDLETILLLAGFVSVALTDAMTLTQRQQALEAAEWQATHDALTGLANRRLVLDTISDRLALGGELNVLYIDVDRFKSVNDLYGHHVGDLLIGEVASRLDRNTRLDDLVGRLAGDEFIVVCARHVDYERAASIAERIRNELNGPVTIDGHTVPLSVSIGIAAAEGVASPDDVINAADVAMYQAKSGGRNRVGRYDEELQARLRRQAELVDRLEATIADGDHFHLAYQPIVEIESRDVMGYEALLRWRDPVLGPITPDVFIPLAEEVGLISRIDDWVMATALREAAEAEVLGVLSVNVSPAWLAGEGVADRLAQLAEEARFPLARLGIEVTERVALAANVTAVLADLRALGVRIMLDDFGTGYSSLAYVQTLEIDGIKIDRGFLDGIGSDRHTTAILEAVVTLTDRLGAVAVAEGVESPAQAEALAALGCRLAQGFLFGRPTAAPTGLRSPRATGLAAVPRGRVSSSRQRGTPSA